LDSVNKSFDGCIENVITGNKDNICLKAAMLYIFLSMMPDENCLYSERLAFDLSWSNMQ